MRATPPPTISSYRGPNHILVTRRSTRAALRSRTNKLLASKRFPPVHLHGLGAAISPTITLAAELVESFSGRLTASCSTSTEPLVDQPDDDDVASDGRLRHNSAVHIKLTLEPPPSATAAKTKAPASKGAAYGSGRGKKRKT